MADCFSFLNAAKLVEHLRNHIKLSHEGRIYIDIGSEIFCKQAADTIEQLLAENAKLKAERDAAVADLKTVTHRHNLCDCCKHCTVPNGDDCNDGNGCEWEWRGAEEKGTAYKYEVE